jgi:aminoglycoside 6'-N-acetyltransferase
MAACGYEFRPLSAADLPLVRGWLAAPHVRRWWGEPNQQFTLVSEDLAEPAMDQYVVAIEEHPFAYLQCYDPLAWPENGLGVHPSGTRGIDQFIGAADMIGRGHGSAFIRQFVERLLAQGTPRVVTDPDPANRRAIRAYEKAGFRAGWEVETLDGRAILMLRDNPDGAAT